MLTFSQICECIDDACGTNSTSFPLTKKAIKINLAQNEVVSLALKNNGWNVDDGNHTHDPFLTTDLVLGQRDYHFTTDEEDSYILDILRVMVKDASGIYHDIDPVDIQSSKDIDTMIDGQNTTGTPTRYDKTGNGIFLDLIPNYNSTAGLKIFVDREPTYFISTDTTKVSGIDGLCHDFLYLKPAYEYARDKGLKNVQLLFRDLQVAIQKVEQRYGSRQRDTNKKMIPNVEDTR